MTKETKRNKNPIIAVCAIVVAVILLVVVAILLFSNKRIDDNFFVSDGSKYVFTMDTDDMLGLDLGEYVPEKTHLVYFYSGNKVTDLKFYYEYENETVAKQAIEYIKEANEGNFKEISISGKYVIITADPSMYEEMTAEDAKQQVEFMEMLQKIDSADLIEEETEEEEEEVVEEEAVEEEEEEEVVEEDYEEEY